MNEIYWITRCDDISCLLTIVSVVCGILSGIALFIMCIAISEEDDNAKMHVLNLQNSHYQHFYYLC